MDHRPGGEVLREAGVGTSGECWRRETGPAPPSLELPQSVSQAFVRGVVAPIRARRRTAPGLVRSCSSAAWPRATRWRASGLSRGRESEIDVDGDRRFQPLTGATSPALDAARPARHAPAGRRVPGGGRSPTLFAVTMRARRDASADGGIRTEVWPGSGRLTSESFVDSFKTELIADRVWRPERSSSSPSSNTSASSSTTDSTRHSATSRRPRWRPSTRPGWRPRSLSR